MRGIIEMILAVSVLVGGGYKALDGLLYAVKYMAAEKILEQPQRSLSAVTRKMTGKKLSKNPYRLTEKSVGD